MKFFRNTSIKKKQTLIVMATCAVALLTACIAFATYEMLTFKTTLEQNISTLAEIIGNNTAAAIDFRDQKSAEETLSALTAEPNIDAACIYSKTGEVFVTYKSEHLSSFTPPPWQASGKQIDHGFRFFRPIERQGEVIGTVYVQSNFNALYARLYGYVLIALVVFCVSGLIAFILSERLQRIISGPILSLVNTARMVTSERDYAVRAVKYNEDELGVLIDAFNDMLQQIQERDSALKDSQAKLENRVMERTSELADSLSLISATLESTTDGILVVNTVMEMTAYNQNFLKIHNWPQHLIGIKDGRILWDHDKHLYLDPESATERFLEIMAQTERDSYDLVEFVDGRIFERYSQPQRIDQKVVGRVWSLRDITQRKRAEKELEELHKQIIETSRQAGMAEVATSVLHNVGNVLNSVNVSASLVTSRMKRSKSANLLKIVDMMKQNSDRLATFLTQDSKGQQITPYLEQLAGNLASEQEMTIDELTQLQSNVEHIKEIVVMQQDYAKLSGFVEKVNLQALLEDSLRMNHGALVRHGVDVVRDYDEILPMDLEKNKILQILVNLIRNAKYACDEGHSEHKTITLRIKQEGSQVKLSISDNGIGILQENMDRIFNHGFTTRKEGHGFGLHSSALAAKQMGGSLNVFSAGRNTGATFTLSLPYLTQPTLTEK